MIAAHVCAHRTIVTAACLTAGTASRFWAAADKQMRINLRHQQSRNRESQSRIFNEYEQMKKNDVILIRTGDTYNNIQSQFRKNNLTLPTVVTFFPRKKVTKEIFSKS